MSPLTDNVFSQLFSLPYKLLLVQMLTVVCLSFLYLPSVFLLRSTECLDQLSDSSISSFPWSGLSSNHGLHHSQALIKVSRFAKNAERNQSWPWIKFLKASCKPHSLTVLLKTEPSRATPSSHWLPQGYVNPLSQCSDFIFEESVHLPLTSQQASFCHFWSN